MTQTVLNRPAVMKQPRIRRRDWILLPSLSLLTICFMAGSAESISRWLYPATQVGFQNCFAADDQKGDAAVKPNSVCWERIPENTSQVEYKFNGRGHRADTELEPKPPGTFRIVLIGSSLTQGLFVPREKTFAALLPSKLSMEIGQKVEVYNEATGGKFRGGPYPTHNSAQHFDEVLAAQPDLILWVISPTDVVNATPQGSSGSKTHSPKPRTFWNKVMSSFVQGTVGERLRLRWEATRTSVVLKRLLLASESRDEYIKSYLKNDEANFLRTEPDAEWQAQWQNFDGELAQIAELAKQARVPLAAAFVPNRPQAVLISKGTWPTGTDPFKLENEVRDNIVSHGGHFIDLLPDYRQITSPERDYFLVDGHPNADGQAIIFQFLATGLTSGALPELKASTSTSIARDK